MSRRRNVTSRKELSSVVKMLLLTTWTAVCTVYFTSVLPPRTQVTSVQFVTENGEVKRLFKQDTSENNQRVLNSPRVYQDNDVLKKDVADHWSGQVRHIQRVARSNDEQQADEKDNFGEILGLEANQEEIMKFKNSLDETSKVPSNKSKAGESTVKVVKHVHKKTENGVESAWRWNGETFKRQRSDRFDHSFIIDGKAICEKDRPPFLVVTVLSVHDHVRMRNGIRDTWGSISRTGMWKDVRLSDRVKVVFLFGSGRSDKFDQIVKNESDVYGDVIQADFKDSYFNLTHKVIMGVRWVSIFCPGAKFILKADEDVFVHVLNLVNYLKKMHVPRNGIYFGHTQANSPVLRVGKWAVSNETYPFEKYPTYVCGNTYVISGNIASRVYTVSGYLPFLNIEDVFVAGIVRSKIGAGIVNNIGFTHWYQKRPKPCEFMNGVRISATKVTVQLQHRIWDVLGSNLEDCFNQTSSTGSNIHPNPKNDMPEGKKSFIKKRVFLEAIKDEHIYLNETSNTFYIK